MTDEPRTALLAFTDWVIACGHRFQVVAAAVDRMAVPSM